MLGAVSEPAVVEIRVSLRSVPAARSYRKTSHPFVADEPRQRL